MKRKTIITTIAAATIMCHTTTANADNWITPMADDVLVSELSIPGTHDSATGNGFQGVLGTLLGNTTAKTQDLSLAEQWDCGIRAFDLRPTVEDGSDGTYLHIYHSMMQTQLSFDDALATLRDKLSENPGEFAIVIMRHESDANSDLQDQWPELMSATLKRFAEQGCLADFKPRLTIGDLRGKILVVSRDTYNNGPQGAYITSWSHDADYNRQSAAMLSGPDGRREAATVQDFYDCTGSDGSTTKESTMLNVLKRRMESTTTRWTINHASGYTINASSGGYRDNAARTSTSLLNYLADENNKQGPMGIIMMDFAGVDKSGIYDVKGKQLTDAIIRQNSRYTPATTAIDALTHGGGAMRVNQGTISSQVPMTIYQTDGTVVAHNVTEAEMTAKGVYIVRNGSDNIKLLVR